MYVCAQSMPALGVTILHQIDTFLRTGGNVCVLADTDLECEQTCLKNLVSTKKHCQFKVSKRRSISLQRSFHCTSIQCLLKCSLPRIVWFQTICSDLQDFYEYSVSLYRCNLCGETNKTSVHCLLVFLTTSNDITYHLLPILFSVESFTVPLV